MALTPTIKARNRDLAYDQIKIFAKVRRPFIHLPTFDLQGGWTVWRIFVAASTIPSPDNANYGGNLRKEIVTIFFTVKCNVAAEQPMDQLQLHYNEFLPSLLFAGFLWSRCNHCDIFFLCHWMLMAILSVAHFCLFAVFFFS